jgi:hypothetical protein
MTKYRVYFIDGNWIDIRTEEELSLGGASSLVKGHFFLSSQVRAFVAHENLGAEPDDSATMTSVVKQHGMG